MTLLMLVDTQHQACTHKLLQHEAINISRKAERKQQNVILEKPK